MVSASNYMDIEHLFKHFQQLTILIIGDVMIDSYLWGNVRRISPEAPIPIVNVTKREKTLGGAANVALNLQALGANPIIVSVVGNDADGNMLIQLLENQQIDVSGLYMLDHRTTTIKHRILAGSQHILRVDAEMDTYLNARDVQRLYASITRLLPKVDAIIFEDYDKGVLNKTLIEQVIIAAKQANIPTIVDPKKRNFLHYKGCTLFKPNLRELEQGINITIQKPDESSLADAVKLLRQLMPIEKAMITLSEGGVFITNHRQYTLIPAHHREITDVSGAGDTVISIAALCLVAGCNDKQVASLANLGGGLVCEHLGVVPIKKEVLFAEAKKLALIS